MLKQRRFAQALLMQACLVAGAGAVAPTAASTEEFTSAYTPLVLDQCKQLSAGGDEADGGTWLCEGYDGIDVRVAEGDLRIFVSFGPDAENQSAAYETLPQFNTIAEKLEWRFATEGGKLTPFATILRYSWNVDGKSGSTLVVTKLAKDNACHMAYVAASGNPQANEQAREIADKDARSFVCKRDAAKHYDAKGNETAP